MVTLMQKGSQSASNASCSFLLEVTVCYLSRSRTLAEVLNPDYSQCRGRAKGFASAGDAMPDNGEKGPGARWCKSAE